MNRNEPNISNNNTNTNLSYYNNIVQKIRYKMVYN